MLPDIRKSILQSPRRLQGGKSRKLNPPIRLTNVALNDAGAKGLTFVDFPISGAVR